MRSGHAAPSAHSGSSPCGIIPDTKRSSGSRTIVHRTENSSRATLIAADLDASLILRQWRVRATRLATARGEGLLHNGGRRRGRALPYRHVQRRGALRVRAHRRDVLRGR
eukprot:scaffold87052_cov81-Phaeocystis_antarctica.AAC.2